MNCIGRKLMGIYTKWRHICWEKKWRHLHHHIAGETRNGGARTPARSTYVY